MLRYMRNPDSLDSMMSRAQRIEYEILDCAINQAAHSAGFTTSVVLFLRRLEKLFPDIKAWDLMQACRELTRLEAIEVSFPSIGGYRHYRGPSDDAALCDAETLRFNPASQGQGYFRQLSELIDAPTGFKRHSGRRP